VSTVGRILVKRREFRFPPPLLFVIAPALEEEKNRMLPSDRRSVITLLLAAKIAEFAR
jgi:hypothetical protein